MVACEVCPANLDNKHSNSLGVPKMPQAADCLWTRVICKQPGRYIGWPTIASRQTGELLVVFSGDRDAHVCPWGKTQLVR